MALVILSICIAMVSLTVGALAFNLAKDGNNLPSSLPSSSTADVKVGGGDVSPSSSPTQQAQQQELYSRKFYLALEWKVLNSFPPIYPF